MIKARYYGKSIGRFVYKTFKSKASMLRAKRGLKQRGCILKPLPTKRRSRKRTYNEILRYQNTGRYRR